MPIWPKSKSWARWLNLYNSFYKFFKTLTIPYPFGPHPGLGPGGLTCTIPFTSLLEHLPSHAHLAQIQILGQVGKLVQSLLQPIHDIGNPMPSWHTSRFWARWPNLWSSFYKPFITLAIPCPAGPDPGFGLGCPTCTILLTNLL